MGAGLAKNKTPGIQSRRYVPDKRCGICACSLRAAGNTKRPHCGLQVSLLLILERAPVSQQGQQALERYMRIFSIDYSFFASAPQCCLIHAITAAPSARISASCRPFTPTQSSIYLSTHSSICSITCSRFRSSGVTAARYAFQATSCQDLGYCGLPFSESSWPRSGVTRITRPACHY